MTITETIGKIKQLSNDSCDRDKDTLEAVLLHLGYRQNRRVERGRECVEVGWYEDYANCPTCCEELNMIDKPAYCPMCGQALDWEVEE